MYFESLIHRFLLLLHLHLIQWQTHFQYLDCHDDDDDYDVHDDDDDGDDDGADVDFVDVSHCWNFEPGGPQ